MSRKCDFSIGPGALSKMMFSCLMGKNKPPPGSQMKNNPMSCFTLSASPTTEGRAQGKFGALRVRDFGSNALERKSYVATWGCIMAYLYEDYI